MAISRISGKQIRSNVLTNEHVAAGAAIDESKLAVDWSAHYSEALETKKVVDYVQVNGKAVTGAEFNLSINGVLEAAAPQATSAGVEEGVIIDAPYNKVVIRDVATGDPLVDEEGEEVFGRLVHDGVDFKVLFFSPAVDGSDEVFSIADGTEIDFQYMERFNLRTISELFAANEKFVAGSADITAFQNLHQLAKDMYGSGYSLDRDGEGNLTVSLQQQITDEVTARAAAITDLKADLAAQGQDGLGAHLIGLHDLANVFTSGSVEGALGELEGRLKEVEESGGVEVKDARNSDLTGAHATLDTRIEADVAELVQQVATEKSRAEAAEGTNAQAISDEATRAQAAEAANAQAVTDEAARAQAAEAANAQAIADETARAEAAEQAVDAKVDSVQAEVDEAKQSTTKGTLDTDGTTVIPKDFVSVDARIEEVEADHETLKGDIATQNAAQADVDAAQDARLDDIEAEITTARGTTGSLDERLDASMNEDGTLKAGQMIHEHFRGRVQATGGESELLLSAFTSKKTLPATFQVGDDSLEVYINGQLQEEGLNYQENLAGDRIIFDLGDGTVLEPTDLVQIMFHINNQQ